MIDIEDAHIEIQDVRKKKSGLKMDVSRNIHEYTEGGYQDSIIPEKIKVLVKTWGCSHNTSDSEYMAGILAKFGYQVELDGSKSIEEIKSSLSKEDFLSKYDVIIFNSCTVKGPSEDHFRNDIADAKKSNLKIIVAGCVPQSRPNVDYLKDISIVGVQQIDRILEVIEGTLNGYVIRLLEEKFSEDKKKKIGGARLDLPKIRKNELIEIIAISTGCLNACTYCKTKHARGELGSYPMEDIVNRAKTAFTEGVKEIWLTSEDLGAYGYDLVREFDAESESYAGWYQQNGCSKASLSTKFPKHYTLADLLARLVQVIPAGCMLRMGMTNPPYILDIIDEICFILSLPRVYSFIHIPVQSGSNEVLRVMQREYTRENFSHLVDRLLGHFGGYEKISIATDIICGFPNENDNDFDDTYELCERYMFPSLYVNQFFARPGTPAASMKRVCSTDQVKRRTAKLHNLFRSYQLMHHLMSKRVRILVTETSSHDQLVGHTKCYQQILIEKDFSLMGKIVEVKITHTDKFFSVGEVIDKDKFYPTLTEEGDESYLVKHEYKPIQTPSAMTKFYSCAKQLPLIEMSIVVVISCWALVTLKSKRIF